MDAWRPSHHNSAWDHCEELENHIPNGAANKKESAITKTFSDFDLIKTMTYKRMPGIINRNAFTAKNTCGSKNRSYGVRPQKQKI